MKRAALKLAMLCLAAGTTAGLGAGALADTTHFEGLRKDHREHLPPRMAVPPLHRPYVDPAFGTRVTRVTDPSQVPGLKRIRHYYSKANPFNADDTRAILFGSDGSTILYDTATWLPLGRLRLASSDPEIQWHPRDPNLFYYLDFMEKSPNVRAMFRYDIRDGSRTLLRDFREYDTARSRNEGNMDREGRFYAMVGWRAGRVSEAFVYDLANDRIGARLPVSESMVDDWISVSPTGRYVVMMGRDRSRVYDIGLRHLRDLPKGSFGHADICLLADGSEALVYDGADHQLNGDRNINIASLATGRVSIGVRIGWRSTPHVSCRNLDLPGWALVSTQGPDRKYPNHDFEVFWLKLDGSGEVRRVAHHHSSKESGGYFAEQHAVANRRGDKIVFSSNWNGGSISDYLVDLKATSGEPSRPAGPGRPPR